MCYSNYSLNIIHSFNLGNNFMSCSDTYLFIFFCNLDGQSSTAPPALRITRKLTRPERQLKLEQHLDEQLERINEFKTDKETNTECVFLHPNQSTIMRMRVQQQQQQQLKTDPNYLTVKRSQTFNTRKGPDGEEESNDYVCRVS